MATRGKAERCARCSALGRRGSRGRTGPAPAPPRSRPAPPGRLGRRLRVATLQRWEFSSGRSVTSPAQPVSRFPCVSRPEGPRFPKPAAASLLPGGPKLGAGSSLCSHRALISPGLPFLRPWTALRIPFSRLVAQFYQNTLTGCAS